MKRSLRILVLLGAIAPGAAFSQAYPTKPIRLVLPYSSGTTTDVLGRLYALKLSETLGQAVIVDNRAGAGGNIAGEAVAKAAPDGYTITLSTSAVHATNPALYGKLPFDAIREFNDFILAKLGKWTKLVKDSNAKVD